MGIEYRFLELVKRNLKHKYARYKLSLHYNNITLCHLAAEEGTHLEEKKVQKFEIIRDELS